MKKKYTKPQINIENFTISKNPKSQSTYMYLNKSLVIIST